MRSRIFIWILWPSFIVAGAAEAMFFTAFDPHELIIFGTPVTWDRTAVYSIGFFAFWTVTAVTSALTCFFQYTPVKIDR